MPFAALDDQFHSNPKLMDAGLEATGLHARAISYCACYLTDGKVPKTWAKSAGNRRAIQALVKHGLWSDSGPCFELNDYLEYNPSKAEVLARKAAKAAGGRLGARRRWSQDTSNGSTHSMSDDKPNGKTVTRARAAPTPSLKKELKERTCTDCAGLEFASARLLREHRENVHGEYVS